VFNDSSTNMLSPIIDAIAGRLLHMDIFCIKAVQKQVGDGGTTITRANWEWFLHIVDRQAGSRNWAKQDTLQTESPLS